MRWSRAKGEKEGGGVDGERVTWTEREERRKARMQRELARALNWPYLAKEVHALNEKYLH